MPVKVVRWECKTCRKDYGYDGYDAARNCECDHIVEAAVAKTKEAIRLAFRRDSDTRPKDGDAKQGDPNA